MRVECASLEEFLFNLKNESNIHRGVVFRSVTRRPMGDNPREAQKYEVEFHVSCIVEDVEDGSVVGQWLLEHGQHCGFDYTDGAGDMSASDRAEELNERLADVCAQRPSLSIRPGRIHE